MKFYSQSYQDAFLDKFVFKRKTGGCFIEIGAYDGEKFSNSLFFEKYRGWQGICIEPLPAQFEKLKKSRKCICVHGAVTNTDGEAMMMHVDGPLDMLSGVVGHFDDRHARRVEKELDIWGGVKQEFAVRTYNINTLMEENGITKVDYCSIDVEGCELDILRTLDFDRFRVEAFTVENNYDDIEIEEFMSTKGYKLLGKLEVDQVYVRSDFRIWNPGLILKLYNKLRKKPKKYRYLKWILK